MRGVTFALYSLASLVAAQNCGPEYNNQVCETGKCCSQYGWCDIGPAHCDPSTCLKTFSGKDSQCASGSISTLRTTTKRDITTAPIATFIATFTATVTETSSPYASEVPVIDVCGNAQGGVSCPGAGLGGYFYRCCSSAGHCGPKNDIQDQNLYCGDGCQGGYGKCDNEEKPPQPTGMPGLAGNGETCGPIVNKKCGDGLCCSGSNFCGTGVDFCGADNWCQKNWGACL